MRQIYNARVNNRLLVLLIFSVLLIICYGGFNVHANIITVEPSSGIIPGGNEFTIDVFLNASEPVKSFECSISFNKNAFSVNSVVLGDYFKDYITQNKFYFNSGIIDNQAGMVSQLDLETSRVMGVFSCSTVPRRTHQLILPLLSFYLP